MYENGTTIRLRVVNIYRIAPIDAPFKFGISVTIIDVVDSSLKLRQLVTQLSLKGGQRQEAVT